MFSILKIFKNALGRRDDVNIIGLTAETTYISFV